MPDKPVPMPLFTRDELKAFRYKCSHKLAISLTVGAVYLLGVTVFFVDKAVKSAAVRIGEEITLQDKLQYYGLAAAGYILLIFLVALIVRRSQALNFSRFLNGCVAFDNFGYMLEYAELRMPEPFSPRFLKYPVHLMILGKVLEHSEKPENAEAGRRMVAASADRDPTLEPYREAELADLMKYHEAFLAERPEMLREWRNAESFHALLVHLILPVAIIVVIVSFILKGCEPPEMQDEGKAKAETTDAVRETTDAVRKTTDAGAQDAQTDAPANNVKTEAGAAAEAENPAVTAPETVPQA